jgi:CheY-like chemotaxis protein
MTKILLVEDDKSLREIYGVRLLAEGYDIVSAGDGEEALAMAIKERPKLIITDVMMPQISGFDMLDILRSTTETRDIKVIMMTALGSEEQRLRGEQLGADRYLVKSQVGIEDVVRVVHEVLSDSAAAAAQPVSVAPAAPLAPRPTLPAPTTVPAPPPRAPVPPASATVAPQPRAPQPVQPHTMPPISSNTVTPPSAKQRIIQPIVNTAPKVDINELLNRELAREAGNGPVPQVPTAAQEKAAIQSQINTFAPSTPVPAGPPAQQQPSAQPQAAPRPVQQITPTTPPQPMQQPTEPSRSVQVPQRPVPPTQPGVIPPQAPPTAPAA